LWSQLVLDAHQGGRKAPSSARPSNDNNS
jgi:hypothetical protein